MSAITELRKLVAHRAGRIKLLYETAEAALKELDRDYVKKADPPPIPSSTHVVRGNLWPTDN